MSINTYQSQHIQQTSGFSSYQLSSTGGSFGGFLTVSGNTTGFFNIYDDVGGLPINPGGKIVASGIQNNLEGDFMTVLNSGLYVEAYGPVSAVFRWN